jgi:hypothetical protein
MEQRRANSALEAHAPVFARRQQVPRFGSVSAASAQTQMVACGAGWRRLGR